MRDLSRCVHHPSVSHEGFASFAVPTYRASTIVFDSAQDFTGRKSREPDGYVYGLHGTPTTRTLEAQLTELHRGVRTIVTPSGQAAIAVVMLSLLAPGDHVLIPDTVYTSVRAFCANYLLPHGTQYDVYDPLVGAGIASLVNDRTRLIWVESPGSVTMEVQDLPAIAAAAKSRGVPVCCDNTWASSLLFKPLEFGADYVVEALTKHVGGHSDIVLGSISVRELSVYRTLKATMRMLGMGAAPDEASLALRGLETMGVRLAHADHVARSFADRLSRLQTVKRVLHPALPSFPGHSIWKRDFLGASGVFSVVVEPSVSARVLDRLSGMKVFAIGPGWGGTRSIIAPMALGSDRTVVPWSEPGTVLRISVGLEDPQDLWSELEQIFAPTV